MSYLTPSLGWGLPSATTTASFKPKNTVTHQRSGVFEAPVLVKIYQKNQSLREVAQRYSEKISTAVTEAARNVGNAGTTSPFTVMPYARIKGQFSSLERVMKFCITNMNTAALPLFDGLTDYFGMCVAVEDGLRQTDSVKFLKQLVQLPNFTITQIDNHFIDVNSNRLELLGAKDVAWLAEEYPTGLSAEPNKPLYKEKLTKALCVNISATYKEPHTNVNVPIEIRLASAATLNAMVREKYYSVRQRKWGSLIETLGIRDTVKLLLKVRSVDTQQVENLLEQFYQQAATRKEPLPIPAEVKFLFKMPSSEPVLNKRA
jgi:hypothetical protein